jgi:hypothetical protein
MIAGTLMIGFTNIYPLIPLLLIGLGYAFVPNSVWPAISLVCGDDYAGTAFGGITGLSSLELLLLPTLVGWLHDSYGGKSIDFILLLISMKFLLNFLRFLRDESCL